ncbi:Out at first protein [Mytilus coruscus]|uniref:Out at first protein n=1 Tax=Mytilus coruscus TaxID=42192 RepID=A0A6J8B6R7_MYTCO|nr:Out at first protein [Mytilus coruscus]
MAKSLSELKQAYILSLFMLSLCSCQLVVNVKDGGGDVTVESFLGNTTSDIVQLQFLNKDGTHVTQFIDFKTETQIFKTYIPWEEEQGFGQSKPQVLCFVSRFTKNEFISSDAMSKLRQKNPSAIRTPEEEKTPESHLMDANLILEKSNIISPKIFNFCRDARDTVFTKEIDIKIWSKSLGQDMTAMMSTIKPSFPAKYNNCKDVNDLSKACLCHYHICIGWYPCGLKYCRGKDSTGNIISSHDKGDNSIDITMSSHDEGDNYIDITNQYEIVIMELITLTSHFQIVSMEIITMTLQYLLVTRVTFTFVKREIIRITSRSYCDNGDKNICEKEIIYN